MNGNSTRLSHYPDGAPLCHGELIRSSGQDVVLLFFAAAADDLFAFQLQALPILHN